MTEITERQRHALSTLLRRHDDYPTHINFATAHLGENTTALLRKLIPLGLVSATRGGSGMRQWFAITDTGRAVLAKEEPKP
ncbi:hypothetical protein HFN71_28905 [Rhizobium laguerreae]|uniref:hypothetical protein n=1 Tax=Rhizobium laguerreae TaxID=1076926 RepID=UPI001C911C3F|nr:hypothetical protein [Rhizobium laguerreae]MBY3543705.1 hypothetical protein [Rhizobium laguerreae]